MLLSENDSSSGTNDVSSRGVFPETLWSLVSEASGGPGDKSESALRQLCAQYRDPIVQRLLYLGHGQEAEDLANGFVEFLLEKNRFASFCRGEVKFRSFLLKCLKGFLRDEWRKRTAGKRGGGQMPDSFDEMEIGHADDLERTLDSQFALTVHRRVMSNLAAEYRKKDDLAGFDGLSPYLLGNNGALSYVEVGVRLGMTANHVKQSVLRLRSRYSEILRTEIMQTVEREEVDQEMRYLVSLLTNTEAAIGA